MQYVVAKASLIGGAWFTGACAEEPTQEPARTGALSQAISSGVRDTANVHRWAVSLRHHSNDTPQVTTSCSGTLVTPTHVLTAKHCMGLHNNGFERLDDPWIIDFHERPDIAPVNQRRAKAGDAILYLGPSVDYDHTDDLALVRVAPRVPGVLAAPRTLPTVGQCPGNYTGATFGYASSGPVHGQEPLLEISWLFDDYCTAQNPFDTAVRRSSWVKGFERHSVPWSNNAYVENHYMGLPDRLCEWYAGGTWFGDSGGPLLTHGNALLCGVNSRLFWWLDAAFVGHVWNQFTATDSPGAAAWLAAELAHPTEPGLLKGQCKSNPSPNEDADGDGIHNACDDCPHVYNMEQNDPNKIAGYDMNVDGIGNACDTCPAVTQTTVSDSLNSNFEAEFTKYRIFHQVALGYQPEMPNGNQVQIRKVYYLQKAGSTSAAEAAMTAAAQLVAAHIRADVCDTNPSSKVVLTNNTVSLSGLAVPPNLALHCSNPLVKCKWEQRTKVLMLANPSTTLGDGVEATLGLRWCECPLGNNATLAGRIACELPPSSCAKNFSTYHDENGPWKKIQTFLASDPTVLATGAEYTIGLGQSPGVDGVDQANWDFRNFPLWYESADGSEKRVRGVLWASVRNLSSGGGSVDFDVMHSWGSGNASFNFTVVEPDFSFPQIELPCFDCEWGLMAVIDDLVNPYQVVSGRHGPFEGPTDELFDYVIKESGSGAMKLLSYGEKDHAFQLLEGTPIGVALGEDGGALFLLTSASFGAPPNVIELPAEGWGDAPFSHTNAAFALSATQRFAVMAGGTHNGVPSGEPNESVALLNLDSGSWTLHGSGATALGHVVASTYSMSDEALWFINRDEVGTLRIGRWSFLSPSAAVEILAAIPAAWSAQDAHLFAAADGKVVIALPLATPGRSRLVLFTDLLTQPRYSGTLDVAVVVRRSPLPGREGVLVVGDQGDLVIMDSVRYADFHFDLSLEAP